MRRGRLGRRAHLAREVQRLVDERAGSANPVFRGRGCRECRECRGFGHLLGERLGRRAGGYEGAAGRR